MAAYQANFTGTNDTLLDAYTSDSGHTHTKQSGDGSNDMRISGNAIGGSGGTAAFYTASYTPPSPDYEIEAVYSVTDRANFLTEIGIRCETDGDGIWVSCTGFEDQWTFYKKVGGSDTVFDTAAMPSDGTFTLKIVASGDNVEWFLDTVSQGSFSLSSDLSAAGLVAFRKYGNSVSGIRIDSATVTEAASGGPSQRFMWMP